MLDALNCWENEELLIPKKEIKKLLKTLFDSMAMGKAKKKKITSRGGSLMEFQIISNWIVLAKIVALSFRPKTHN